MRQSRKSSAGILLLATSLLTGCAATSSPDDRWSYLGNDPELKSPPMMRLGDASDPAWRLEAQEKMAAWQLKLRAASDVAKSACVRETGESATSGLVSGYGKNFIACMKTRGWGIGYSNPL